MFIINNKKWFFVFTGVVILLSLASLGLFGLKLGIDFTGGTLVVAHYDARPSSSALSDSLNKAGFKNYSLREEGTGEYVLRIAQLSNDERANLAQTFSVSGSQATIEQLTEIGPTIGAELRNKSILAISLVLLCILLFIAFAFRKVSKPISSWRYGAAAIVGLVHNVIVTAGFYALLGHFTGVQVDTLFVTALLTVLGFSVHDTIVVFDRVRENLRTNQERNRREEFTEVAGRALSQTIVRSINTSLTVVLTLAALYFFGPVSTKAFSLTLLVGIVAGTYSSICLATPLLVAWAPRFSKDK